MKKSTPQKNFTRNQPFSLEDVAGARSGKRRSFERLVKQIRPVALHYATAILRDGDLAEDAVQEALVEAHKHLKDLRNAEAFLVWFRRIVWKHCNRITRRSDFQTLTLTGDQLESQQIRSLYGLESGTSSDLKEQSRLLQMFRQALLSEEVTRQEQDIARLRFEKNRSYEQIAQDLNISIHTVKNRLRTVRQKLRYLMSASASNPVQCLAA